ncbi:unnamed protein product [Candidula unifasciata]|uniref:Methyltransferase domain-containing protein n=1 Tax=Candidula unifasciata TaxID=100452 RepID=A0A8S3ZW08_9EUPU|nr:unnamed protein product [Candidula unifasciata]
MGHLGDGGWEICDDPEVRPVPPCLIYSFGIGRDFSFDDEAARWYKCHVYSFDPTIEWNSYNRSHFVHFYNVGIANKTYTNNKGWKYSTFSDIRAMLGHKQSCINIVKIDVEGHEWDSLLQMTLSGQLNTVNQLLIEYHFNSLTHRYLLKFFIVLQGVELAGFEVFYTHKNEGCGYRVQGFPPIKSRCFEVHYRRRYKVCQSAI